MKNIALSILGIAIILALPNFGLAQSNPDSATIKFNLSLDEGYLILNEDFSNCIEIKNGAEISVPAGYTKIRFAAKYFHDSITGMQLAKGEKKELTLSSRVLKSQSRDANKSSFARCYWDTNVFIFSDKDSKISVNGKQIGEHSTRLVLEEGLYRTTAESDDIKVLNSFRVDNSLLIVRNYVRPKRIDVYKKVLVPGYAQIAKRQYLKSTFFITGAAVFGASALIFDNKINLGNKEYDLLRTKYRQATDPNEVLYIISQSEKKMDQLHDYERARKISLIGLVTVYGLNIIDGFIPPKSGFRTTKFEFNPYVDFDKSLVPTATLKINLK